MTASNGELQDGRADFDFEIGRWKVHSRRLKEWLKGSTAWEDFEGISVARKVLGGLGLIGEITNERATGPAQGMTVRLFDPQTQQWSIYFADSVHGTLTTPLIGRFTQGRGVFYALEPIQGMHIFSRFLWLDITATSYRWDRRSQQMEEAPGRRTGFRSTLDSRSNSRLTSARLRAEVLSSLELPISREILWKKSPS